MSLKVTKLGMSVPPHLTLPQQSSRYTQKLPFSYREVLSILQHLRLQFQGQLGNLERTVNMDRLSFSLVGLPMFSNAGLVTFDP